MAATISDIIAHFKADVAHALSPSVILQTCQRLGHQHRERVLGPVATVHAFLTQILHGNTACSHLPHLTGQSFTASAYCEARSSAPLGIVRIAL